MTIQSLTSVAASQCSANSRFADHFGVPLPRGLREQSDHLSWQSFVAVYNHSLGPLRLGRWACTDPHRAATRLGPQARNYQATIAIGDRIYTSDAAASGPVSALTAMLHDGGIAVEMLKFHQMQSATHTATFVYGSDGERAEWAMGLSQDKTQSALRAVVGCVNRLRTSGPPR